ncbi:MarR family transcriptional regulator [Amycolatopsis sp. RM579]|uniref:MarR family transcriptional regulator n=2 Tax=Amycolatopsis pithecellobii TaxID=664692 RepID=A0A6N7YXB0_9PSEU|nr:MarR family transcriptional regulator [Amycolatopsis pithecellobii]
MPPRNHTPPAELLVSLLRQGERWFTDQLTARMEDAGITPMTVAHTLVLAHLDEAGASTAELARRAGVTRQTMHRAIRQLTAEGLVYLEPGTGFPRTGLVRVTQTGTERRRKAQDILADLEDELGDHLGSETVAILRSILKMPWPKDAR